MSELLCDVNEPPEMFTLIQPVIQNVQVIPLNSDGYADYRWTTYEGKVKQVERKTWGELLGNVDKVEEQLSRHLTKHPQIELVFLLEGLVEQTSNGSRLLHKQKNGFVTKGRELRTRLNGVYSWLYQIGKYCEIIQTPSLVESATAICAMYKADQKNEHSTLHRTIKQLNYHPDPRVVTLMGISPGLGEIRASALINQFISPWNVVSAGWVGEPVVKNKYDLTVVNGIGKVLVDNVLRNFGRPDV